MNGHDELSHRELWMEIKTACDKEWGGSLIRLHQFKSGISDCMEEGERRW